MPLGKKMKSKALSLKTSKTEVKPERRGRGPVVIPNKLMKTIKLEVTGDSTGKLVLFYNNAEGQRKKAEIEVSVDGKLEISKPRIFSVKA